MKLGWRNAWLGMAAVAVLASAPVGTARAAIKVRSDFLHGTKEILQDGGLIDSSTARAGWRSRKGGDHRSSQGKLTVDLAKAGINPQEGSFDFLLRRGEEYHRESLFTLHDEQGETLFNMTIDWEDSGGYLLPPPVLNANGFWRTQNEQDRARGDLWVPLIPLRVGRGQSFRITVTWGGGKPDSVYIDGVKMDTQVSPYLAEDADSFREILAKSKTMDLGVEASGEWFGNQMTSVIEDFRILDVATAERARDPLPEIQAVSHNAARIAGFSGKLIAGNTVGVTVTGTPGAVGSFDVVHFPDIASKIALDWRGWGIYLEEKVFFEPGEVNLRDVEGYEVYVSQSSFDALAPGFEPLARLETGEQQYTVETPAADKPYYVAVVATMRNGSRRLVLAPISNRPLQELTPGVYTGSYKVGWQDRYPRAVAIAHLVAGAYTASLAAANTFVMDPALTITVGTDPQELKADEKSVANVTVTVTDANGNPVPEHEIKFLLFTTSQYTGVVGGGSFAEQVGGTVQQSSFGKTDLFGKVSATYVAGFAAKTAIIVARDMLSNNTGSGWVKTFITATAQLELEPVAGNAAMDAGYQITVTSSDEWLTADGKSTARITARVKLNGSPVEGHAVGFGVSSGNGSIRVVSGTTDRNGEARAVYTAGKKIGVVLVTATDLTVGISASVQIELRSDAPAKIAIKIDPEKLPADGRSRADLKVLVTDINDNPNDGVEVEYSLVEGSGTIRDNKGLTDRRGESATQYVAGKTPGRVTFEITVRSTVPTAEELAKVNDQALAVTDYKFF